MSFYLIIVLALTLLVVLQSDFIIFLLLGLTIWFGVEHGQFKATIVDNHMSVYISGN